MSAPAIQLLAERQEMLALPPKVRRMIHDSGIPRLTRCREAISRDAGLAMPPIRVVPWGFVGPSNSGVVYGAVRPVDVAGIGEFGCIIPAATLVAVDNDSLLRRVITHEFGHCFWWTVRAFNADAAGARTIIDADRNASIEEQHATQVAKDHTELLDPAGWFGEWDVKHFIREYGGASALDRANERFRREWLGGGLPVKVPELIFDFRGSLRFPDEIIARARKLGLIAAAG